MSRLTPLVLACLALAGCGGSDEPDVTTASTTATTAAAGANRALTQEDSGKPVAIMVGAEVAVELETCPGCGYEWRITGEPDPKVLKLESREQRRPATTGTGPPLVGGSETVVFTFEGVGEGETQVVIGYFGPAKEEPDETFTLPVTVAASQD